MVTDNDIREWDINVARLIRLGEYRKTKELLGSIEHQLAGLVIDDNFVPRNARQGAIQYHTKVKKPALEKQRERLSKKLVEMEELIKKDIATI